MPKTRTFLLKDERHPQKPVATLEVVETGKHSTNQYTIKVRADSNPSLSLKVLVKHAGTTTITGKRAADWIAGRATPAGRQNIGDVLHAVGLRSYDAWGIVQGHKCRCTRDHIYMEEIQDDHK